MFDLSKVHEAVRAEGGVSRRLFLAYAAALSALPAIGRRATAADRRVAMPADPFQLGVASGDPDSTSVVLWTRLCPKPLEPDYGMKAESIPVSWELADDDGFKKVVRSGTAVATPQLGHSVHVLPRGLSPNRWYFYRFRAGDAVSPVGRTRTAPALDASPDKLRFAFASCQSYEGGLYTAYQQMAADELDLVFHLGDYIYEYPNKKKNLRKLTGPTDRKIQTLEDYRGRHALYRSDPLLHGMHARCPWVVTWDDHEFDNNYANEISEKEGVDPAAFLEQRANAYQAYYEAMPLRPTSLPKGPHLKLYRTCHFGRLAAFQVLDTRQYRSDQPNNDRPAELNEAALNPKNSMLGADQANWLKSALIQSDAVWNVLAQQVMMGMVGLARGEGGPKFSMDQWPGYAAERMKLMQFLADRRVPNPVVLTGDIHSNWVNDLRVDDRKPETPVVATEFVGTSISSGGNGQEKPIWLSELLNANPCVKFHNTERGYVRCVATPGAMTADYVAVEDVTKPGGKIVTRASFVVEAGTPGAKKM